MLALAQGGSGRWWGCLHSTFVCLVLTSLLTCFLFFCTFFLTMKDCSRFFFLFFLAGGLYGMGCVCDIFSLFFTILTFFLCTVPCALLS